MFVGFNLVTSKDYAAYYDIGKKLFEAHKESIEKDLDKFIGPEGVIDGSRIAQNWFPEINADVFISHSHKDEKQAIGLAGWLWTKFQIVAFIDSGVWGYAGDLLRKIDDKYCWDEERSTYMYEIRNYSTAHVHMMLNVALVRMIDKVECVILFNTPNSINTKDVGNRTTSSWIYSEIVTTELIRTKKLSEYRKKVHTIYMEEKSMNNQLQIDYDVQLTHLKTLSDSDLQLWERSVPNPIFLKEVTVRNKVYALDKLYKIKEIL